MSTPATSTPTLRVLQLQRMSTEDGPGLRTTLFLKGCSLACTWCHNPESLSPRPEVLWHADRCIACGLCVPACRQGNISAASGSITHERARCAGCGACAHACPTTAWVRLGEDHEVAALVAELRRDQSWLEESNGGVTVSGGEPLLQARALLPLLRELGAAGVHRALDTCGQGSAQDLRALVELSDLVLFDLKLADPTEHRRFTGSSNERIITNLRATAAQLVARGGPPRLWVRTPLIPGATATEDNLRSVGALLAELPAGALARWELCAFNHLCREQYQRLGQSWDFAETPLLPPAELERLAEVARGSGVDPACVHTSGPAALPDPSEEAA